MGAAHRGRCLGTGDVAKARRPYQGVQAPQQRETSSHPSVMNRLNPDCLLWKNAHLIENSIPQYAVRVNYNATLWESPRSQHLPKIVEARPFSLEKRYT